MFPTFDPVLAARPLSIEIHGPSGQEVGGLGGGCCRLGIWRRVLPAGYMEQGVDACGKERK